MSDQKCGQHKWIVYSTSLCPPTIMVYCEKCDVAGYVEDFTDDEWNDAFFAPVENYLWEDEERVKEGAKKE